MVEPDLELERALIAKTRMGDTEAFGDLVLRHQARLRAFAARYVGSSDDVYDLVQDTFVNAYRSLDRFDESRDFGKWLRGICRNRILKYYRESSNRSKRMESITAVLQQKLEAETLVDDGAIDRIEAIRACIQELKGEQRELILNRHFYEKAVKDMALQLNKSAASVSVNLMRIRAKLRLCYERRMQNSVAR